MQFTKVDLPLFETSHRQREERRRVISNSDFDRARRIFKLSGLTDSVYEMIKGFSDDCLVSNLPTYF
jgi:hypothetical protein